MAELEGQTFAGYEIISKLGEGGMGTVYKARQPMLNRLIALKVLPAHLAKDGDFVARFKREANSAAALSHQNLVRVYSAGESDGTHYIAMEFVEGHSLRDHIEQKGRLNSDEALAICYYVADGLRYAWNRGQFIHRDIKPDNVFLSNTGEVKVGDMGLAKRVGAETTGLTQTGTAMGSPHYVSPEQAQGKKDIDFRADIYSLGCTLFHMVTGQTPYDGTDAMSVMMMHVNNLPPAMLKVWPQCPMPLVMLIGRMLKKNPRERHQSYEELQAEIMTVRDKIARRPSGVVAAVTPVPTATPKPQPAASAPKARPTAAPPKNSPVALYAIAGVAALAVIAGAVFFLKGKGGSPSSATVASQTPRFPSSTEQWVDGLAEWVAAPNNVSGGIMRAEAGAWRIVKGASIRLGTKLPGQSLANVAVRVTVRIMDGKYFNIRLRDLANGKAHYDATFWSNGRSAINLSADGKTTELGNFKIPAGFVAGPSHVFEFRAEGDLLTLLVDGQTAGSVKDPTLTSGRFSINGVGCLIEKIECRDLGSAPAAPADASGEKWIDGLAEWVAMPNNVSGGIMRAEAGAWRIVKGVSIMLGTKLPGRSLANVAVRVTIRDMDGHYLTIPLRCDAKTKGGYAATMLGNGKSHITLSLDKKTTEIGHFQIPAGFVAGPSHVLEFRAEGDLLTVVVDGQTAGSVKDPTLTSGRFSINGVGCLIEKIEYRDLGGGASSPAGAGAPQ